MARKVAAHARQPILDRLRTGDKRRAGNATSADLLSVLDKVGNASPRAGGQVVRKHRKCEPRNGSFAFIHIQTRFKAHRYWGYCWDHAPGVCSRLCAPSRYVETGCRGCTLRRQVWLKHQGLRRLAHRKWHQSIPWSDWKKWRRMGLHDTRLL